MNHGKALLYLVVFFAPVFFSVFYLVLPFAQRVEELEGELKEKDSELLKRDRIITELRLRLPATSDRDAVFDKVASQSIKSPRDEDYEGSQAVRVATSTVSSLQVCTHRYSYNTHTHTHRFNGNLDDN